MISQTSIAKKSKNNQKGTDVPTKPYANFEAIAATNSVNIIISGFAHQNVNIYM